MPVLWANSSPDSLHTFPDHRLLSSCKMWLPHTAPHTAEHHKSNRVLLVPGEKQMLKTEALCHLMHVLPTHPHHLAHPKLKVSLLEPFKVPDGGTRKGINKEKSVLNTWGRQLISNIPKLLRMNKEKINSALEKWGKTEHSRNTDGRLIYKTIESLLIAVDRVFVSSLLSQVET